MQQKIFAEKALIILKKEPEVVGLAIGGSWISDNLDQYSDLDLVVITKQKISHNFHLMQNIASKLGKLINAFTGEHVGEPRLLICLYDDPLLHVDIKFVTVEEFKIRVENPVILLDKEGTLSSILINNPPNFPYPDYQWIEDRFWTWIHYSLLKIGRGELMEALDFMAFLRMVVFGPLLHIKNKNIPRGVRKVEFEIETDGLAKLHSTTSIYDKKSILQSLENAVKLYLELRTELFMEKIIKNSVAQKRVTEFFEEIKKENH